jgi:hypothetical protein
LEEDCSSWHVLVKQVGGRSADTSGAPILQTAAAAGCCRPKRCADQQLCAEKQEYLLSELLSGQDPSSSIKSCKLLLLLQLLQLPYVCRGRLRATQQL